MREADTCPPIPIICEVTEMEKEFRVNAIYPDRPEGLILLLRAASLNSAVKKLRYSTDFQLPTAQYYVYESGRYLEGVSIALTPAFVKHLRISQAEGNMINGYLQAQTEEQFQDEDHTISNTVVFPDGMQMDVKCCGAQEACSWTEAVLFDENGCEVCHSEVSDQYDGTWELVHQNRRYVAIVHIRGASGSGRN